MFDNILYQDRVISRLRHDILNESLPPSILFSGPAMSGKLTAAIELARVLSCEKEAAWNCTCSHCRLHRALSHPRTLLVGSRDLTAEIAASAEVLRRNVSDAPRFLVARSAGKLIRRFDPVLWSGEEKKLSKIVPVMNRLAETVDDILPGSPLSEGDELEKLLDGLVDDCASLQKVLPSVIPVLQIRHITSWAVHSAAGDHKTVIIDAADRMPEASRNALLKFLEEPPADTTAILICDRKSMLLPTIVSRLRDYSFPQRKASEEAEVLRRVFREETNRWSGLKEYFRAWRSGPSERMKETAAEFLQLAQGSRKEFPDAVSDIKDIPDLIAFLEALGEELRLGLRTNPSPDHRRAQNEAAWLRDARMRAESLNLPIPMILRGLFSSFGGAG